MGMRLYSVTDFTLALRYLIEHQEASGRFTTGQDTQKRNEFIATQSSGMVSQRFKVTVEAADNDPI